MSATTFKVRPVWIATMFKVRTAQTQHLNPLATLPPHFYSRHPASTQALRCLDAEGGGELTKAQTLKSRKECKDLAHLLPFHRHENSEAVMVG